MIKLQVRIGNLSVQYYFGITPNFPPGILVGTAFIDKHIDNISPIAQTINPRNSSPVPIIARSPNQVSAIQTPNPLTRFIDDIDGVPISIARKTVITAGNQKLVQVTSSAIGLVSLLPNELNLNSRHCQIANGIEELRPKKSFHVWVANLYNKPKHLP